MDLPYRDAWPLIGLALGGGAMFGDALKSLIKRARGIAPGQRWVAGHGWSTQDQLGRVVLTMRAR